jgi:serine protease
MTQYCEGVAVGATSCPANASHVGFPSGGALAGVVIDTASPAPNQATATQLAQEAIASAGKVNPSNNRNSQYVIVSPTGTHPDGFNAPLRWCAWHDWNGSYGLNSPYGDIAFTNLPYLTDVGGSCGQSFVHQGAAGALDGVTIVEGHEYAETITDQNPAGGWTDSSGSENGDKCAWITPGTAGGAGDVTMSTGAFPMQTTWANDAAACELSHPIVGVQTPDFTMGVSPSSQSVVQGSGTSYTVNVGAVGGFSSSVGLTVTGLPNGASGSFSPQTATAPFSSTLTVSSGTSVAGTYPLTITGTAGAVTHTTSATLTVTTPKPIIHISSMHAFELSGSRNWSVWGDATVFDQNGQAVSGVTVTFSFTVGASATRTCVTDSTGFCSTTGSKVSVSNHQHNETVTVTNVVKSGDTWNGVQAQAFLTH